MAAAGKTYAVRLNYSAFVEADVNEDSIQVMSGLISCVRRQESERESEREKEREKCTNGYSRALNNNRVYLADFVFNTNSENNYNCMK